MDNPLMLVLTSENSLVFLRSCILCMSFEIHTGSACFPGFSSWQMAEVKKNKPVNINIAVFMELIYTDANG